MSGLWTAAQYPVDPLGGYGVQAVHRAQERPANGCVGIGVPSPHDRIDDARFKVRSIVQLPQGITKRDQHPTLLPDVVSRWLTGNGIPRAAIGQFPYAIRLAFAPLY